MKDNNRTTPNVPQAKLGPQLTFAATEAYNLLRTNLEFSFPDQDGGKVVGITSSHPQEGKSYTSINLAYSLAEDGRKVALVDADLRKSNMAQTLSITVKNGISDYLAHKVEKPEDIFVEHVLSDNLTLFPSGNVPPNPAELIGSARMEVLLKTLAKVFDYVIVDLPPVLDVSDAVIITKYLDGIVVVVRNKVTRRSELKETVRRLKFSKVRLLGFVYNTHSNVPPEYSSYHSEEKKEREKLSDIIGSLKRNRKK